MKVLMKIKKLLQYLHLLTIHHGRHVVKHVHHHAKRIVHHSHKLVHQHKHHFLVYTHIFLLFAFFAFYHLDGVIFAQEEGEGDTFVQSIEFSQSFGESDGKSFDFIVNEKNEILQSDSFLIGSGEGNVIDEKLVQNSNSGLSLQIDGESFSGKSVTGSFGGVISGFSSIEFISGDIISGENFLSVNSFPLSVLYPEKEILLNSSGYVVLTSLESVLTTGGEEGMTYCSRIAYENISRILKAGMWTWKETNDYILQGDADQIIRNGIFDKSLIEVSTGQLLTIFTGNVLWSGASVYDVYVDFLVSGIRVYHRIVLVYADDGIWYVLDPLRGQKTVKAQKFSEYLSYYDDEDDVHWYLGKSYSPLYLGDFFVDLTGWIELKNFQFSLKGKDFLFSKEDAFLSLSSGLVNSGLVNENVGLFSGFEILSGDEKELFYEEMKKDLIVSTGINVLDIPYNTYFHRAFKKGESSQEVLYLQKVLKYLGYFSSEINGIFDLSTMEAIYQFQLAKNIFVSKNDKKLYGYFGPTTRSFLNMFLSEYYHSGSVNLDKRKDLIKAHLMKKGFSLTSDGLTLLGTVPVDMQSLSGELLTSVILQSPNELSGAIAEVKIPEGALVQNAEGKEFTGALLPPIFIETEDISTEEQVLVAIDVGSEEHVEFVDTKGNPLYAMFKVPIFGASVGDVVSVNYSEDGQEWTYMNSVPVVDIDGQTYAIFYSNHFTQFYLGTLTGTFTINNDDAYTTGLTVILTSNVSGATHMRFGNSIEERNAASWVPYSGMYTWILTGLGGDGIKWVYAQFSGNGVIRNVSDSIIYDTNSGSMFSGLQAHLDGTTGGVRFIDSGPRELFWTGFGNASKVTLSGEEVIFVDGNGDYIQNTSGFITAYPFTISAWVRPSRVNVTQEIAMFGNSTVNNIFYGIRLVNANAVAVASNTTARSATNTTTLVANQWYHIVGVFTSPTSRTIYVDNANPATNTTTVNFASTNPRWRVGMHPGSTTTNYFSGWIDEVRIYNKALTTGERQELYMIPPSFDPQIAFTGTPVLYGELPPKIAQITVIVSGVQLATTGVGAGTGKWKTLPYTTGFANGTYAVTLNYRNVYGKTGTLTYMSGLIINTSGITITYVPSTWTSGNVLATLTGLDPTYMIVNNFGSEFYTFTGNGSFVWQYVDKQGTTGSMIANVSWIDKISPIFSGVVSGAVYTGVLSGNLYVGNVSITFDDANLSGATLNGIPYLSGTLITGEGNYLFEVSDLAGNKTGASFSIIFPIEQKINNQLINSGYVLSMTGLVPLDDTYYIGTADINMGPFTGQLLVPTLLRSDNLFGGNLAEVEIPVGAVLKNAGGIAFTGILNVPTFQSPSTYESALGKPIISALDVGNTSHIYFKDTGNNQLFITYRMPVPGKNAGDLVDIYMSEDGNSFVYHTTVRTILIDGQPYVSFVADHMSVVVTSPNNGINISADKAANSTSGSAYTTLNNIVIAEGVNTDLPANQTNVTLILTAPTNRRFNPGVGTVSYVAGRDITSASINVTSATITITFSTDNNANRSDTITISGIQVQAITGNLLPSSGNILRTCSNPGTATIVGITCDVTNFGSLSQTFGIHKYLVITMPGQTFVAGSGNSGTAHNQYAYSGFVISKITATDQFYNIVTLYTGNKILSYTGPGGNPSYTTGVTFVTGQSTTPLNTILTEAKTGVTITVSDGIITGPASSPFDVIDNVPPTANVEYVPASGTLTTGTVLATLTGFNKSGIVVTNNSGSTSYLFTGNGSFIFELQDGNGNTGNVTATVTWIRKSWLSFSTLSFYENQVSNNGSITGNMIVTLGTGAFTGNIVNYVTLTNIPAGLTGVFTLSGTNKLIVMLSGNAVNHSGSDSTGNLALIFATGAFVDMYPSDVIDSIKTGISVIFYGPNPIVGLTPIDDTMIDADTDPTGVGNCADGKCQRMNYGATNYLCASDFGSKNLFRFNLASLPTGAVITSASLRLYRYHIAGATDATGFTLKKIINNSGWIEGTRDAQEALTGEPNYIQRKWKQEYWYNGSPGMQQNLDYASTNLINEVGFTGSNTGSYAQWFTFNSAGLAVLQSWADGEENQGLVMGDIPNTPLHRLCIRSKEATTVSERPLLNVTYYVDTTSPVLMSLSPANNESGVKVDANLFMYFSENVYAVSGYTVSIRKLVDGSLVESINVANTNRVLITNNQVRIDPTNDFQSFTGYYIEVASGAFKDKAGNVYPGFTGSATRRFTTVDTTQTPIVTGLYVTGITSSTGIFGARVQDDRGFAIIERGFCWSIVQGFNDCTNKVSETGNSLGTGDFVLGVQGLPSGSRIYVKAFATSTGGTAYTTETGFWTKPNQVTVLSPTKVDNDSFYVHWNPVTGASSYRLYLSTDSGFATYVTGYGPMTGITSTSFKVTGLERTTQYYYKVSAYNTGGEGIHSLVTGVMTTFYPTPIAWLKFEETSGTIAYDSAEGSYHDGIIFGDPAKNQTGIDGKAFCYDGINDDVNIVNFNYGSRYTIGFWFKTTSTGNNMHMFSHGGDNDSSSINVILDGATKTLRTYINGNQNLFILGSGVYNTVVDGNWHYYTVSVDNSGAVPGKYQVIVYVDGLYELIDSSLNSTQYLPINNLVLGRVSNTTTGYYKGCIDDFRIFDQVITTGEVWDLFNQLKPGAAGTLSITGPVNLDFGVWDANEEQQIVEIAFTGNDYYFQVNDTLGSNLGYYTTLSLSNFTTISGDILSYNNISVKTMTGIVTLSGDINSSVTSAITGVYQSFGGGPLTFIRRPTGENYGRKGTYGTWLGFQITIPALQNVGNYTGILTFTIYDN